jgi:uncharacterized protein (UPF0332 family)
MSLKEEDRRILVALELERAEKTLREMEVQFQNELWAMVANRLYYALFHAVSALLISEQHEVGTHRGAVNRFHMFYVKEGIFTDDEGQLYSRLQTLRENGEYNCTIEISKKEAVEKIEPTRTLIEKIKKHISDKQEAK